MIIFAEEKKNGLQLSWKASFRGAERSMREKSFTNIYNLTPEHKVSGFF